MARRPHSLSSSFQARVRSGTVSAGCVRGRRNALSHGEGIMLDLLIRGGDVVTPQGIGKWTIGIQGERIAAVGLDDPSVQAARVIDAGGKIVVPGGIEPHAR